MYGNPKGYIYRLTYEEQIKRENCIPITEKNKLLSKNDCWYDVIQENIAFYDDMEKEEIINNKSRNIKTDNEQEDIIIEILDTFGSIDENQMDLIFRIFDVYSQIEKKLYEEREKGLWKENHFNWKKKKL